MIEHLRTPPAVFAVVHAEVRGEVPLRPRQVEPLQFPSHPGRPFRAVVFIGRMKGTELSDIERGSPRPGLLNRSFKVGGDRPPVSGVPHRQTHALEPGAHGAVWWLNANGS